MLCVDHVHHPFNGHAVSRGGPSGVILFSVSKVKESPPSKRRWQRGNEVQGNPDEMQAAARSRVERLETAVAVLGEGDSTEIRGTGPPSAAQVEECQAFIQRSQRRLQRLQEEQVKEQQQLDTALERMARFREEMTRTTGPATVGVTGVDPTPTQPGKVPELVAELDRLRARVAEMEVKREEVRKKRSTCWSTPGCAYGDSDQSGEHSGSVEPIQPVGVTKDSRMSARYGLRDVRVGEAKNPGPRRRLRRVSSEGSDPRPASVGPGIFHDLTLVDSSDDDAPFVLPGSRRRTQNSDVESDDEGNVARRDFSLPVPSVVPGSEAMRMEDSSGLPRDRVRRLSLFSEVDPVRPTVPDSDGSGTEAPTSVSDGFREDPPDRPEDVMFADIPLSPALQAGFRWLATVDVEAVFRRRAVLMKTVPVFMQGAHRSAMRVAISEIGAGRSNGDRTRSAAGWRLFMLLPRLLLFRPPRGGLVPKSQLSQRFQAFSQGDWRTLFEESEGHACTALKSRSRRRRRNQSAEQYLERRAARAESWASCQQHDWRWRGTQWPQVMMPHSLL